jgi:hypothetical protein
LSDKGTDSGSTSQAEVHDPVATGTGTRSACGPGTRPLAAAIFAARVPAARAAASDRSGTA